ncbi:MAG: hypothetical protein ACK42F_11090, partial [Sphingobacteriales bacterium]
PILLLFLLIIAVFIIFKPWLHSIGFDVHMLTIGNGIIFLMTFLSSKLLLGSMKAANSASFLRGVYGSFLIKFLIVAIAVLVYAFIKRSNVNKIGIFTLMGIYLVYTYIEISSLLKQTKKDV